MQSPMNEAQRGSHSRQQDFRGANGNFLFGANGAQLVALCFAIAAFAVAIANSLFLIHMAVSAQLEVGFQKAQAVRDLAVEKRLNTDAIDELRLEFRQTLKAAGVEAPNRDDHTPVK